MKLTRFRSKSVRKVGLVLWVLLLISPGARPAPIELAAPEPVLLCESIHPPPQGEVFVAPRPAMAMLRRKKLEKRHFSRRTTPPPQPVNKVVQPSIRELVNRALASEKPNAIAELFFQLRSKNRVGDFLADPQGRRYLYRLLGASLALGMDNRPDPTIVAAFFRIILSQSPERSEFQQFGPVFERLKLAHYAEFYFQAVGEPSAEFSRRIDELLRIAGITNRSAFLPIQFARSKFVPLNTLPKWKNGNEVIENYPKALLRLYNIQAGPPQGSGDGRPAGASLVENFSSLPTFARNLSPDEADELARFLRQREITTHPSRSPLGLHGFDFKNLSDEIAELLQLHEVVMRGLEILRLYDRAYGTHYALDTALTMLGHLQSDLDPKKNRDLLGSLASIATSANDPHAGELFFLALAESHFLEAAVSAPDAIDNWTSILWTATLTQKSSSPLGLNFFATVNSLLGAAIEFHAQKAYRSRGKERKLEFQIAKDFAQLGLDYFFRLSPFISQQYRAKIEEIEGLSRDHR
ncbi:MAG: hypothetical protein C5B49_14030 [Bdellovibrio sp.]|nr:MAG: hypothetical protein C5B49_14030 [Bdellovibrio sp.]